MKANNMTNPLQPSNDHVANWLDRTGNIEFICDQDGGATMNPRFYWAALRDHDKSIGRIEAATWWM